MFDPNFIQNDFIFEYGESTIVCRIYNAFNYSIIQNQLLYELILYLISISSCKNLACVCASWPVVEGLIRIIHFIALRGYVVPLLSTFYNSTPNVKPQIKHIPRS